MRIYASEDFVTRLVCTLDDGVLLLLSVQLGLEHVRPEFAFCEPFELEDKALLLLLVTVDDTLQVLVHHLEGLEVDRCLPFLFLRYHLLVLRRGDFVADFKNLGV